MGEQEQATLGYGYGLYAITPHQPHEIFILFQYNTTTYYACLCLCNGNSRAFSSYHLIIILILGIIIIIINNIGSSSTSA